MRIARGLGAAVAASFVLSVLAIVAPGTGAQAQGVTIEDGSGDVVLCAAGQAPTCSPSPDQESAKYLDLTKVAFGKESGRNITIEFTVVGMETTPPTLAQSLATVTYLACFKFDSVPFGASAKVVHSPQYATKSVIPGPLFVASQACTFAATEPSRPEERKAELFLSGPDMGVDMARNTLWMQVQRKDLATLRAAAGGSDLSPQAGDQLTDLTGAVRSFSTVPFTRQPSLHAEDSAGPGGPFVFALATANELLEIRVKTNTVDRGLRVPEYSVDAGGFQAVPVEILNRAAEEKSVTLNATLRAGDESKWTFSLVPTVKVPGLSDAGEPGLRIVTLVVEPEEGVKHLEKARVEIAAAFADAPLTAGTIEVEVKAIYPPTPENPRLWLHYGPVEGSSSARPWMNTLKDDPRAAKGDAAVYRPSDGGSFTIFIDPDVQPSKDLILDAQADGVLNLTVEAGSETDVEYTVYVANGEDRVALRGDGRIHLPGPPTAVSLRMPVQPDSRDDKELRVEAGVGKGIRLFVKMTPSGGATAVGTPATGTSLSLHIPGSSLDMPIVRVEAPGLTNISQKGARISMHLVEEKDLHVNPGKTRALNFTVLNEGVYDDTVHVKLAFNQSSGWRVALLPTATFKLPPGEGANFGLFVTPPMGAEEDSALLMEVMASSKVDPAVVTKLRYEFIVTRGVQLDDEGGLADSLKAKGGKKGGVPGFEAMAALAAVGAATLLAGRRRA